jgi:hypothetical protein
MKTIPMVTIAVTEYEQLLADSEELGRLKAAGLEDWEGYNNAVDDELYGDLYD